MSLLSQDLRTYLDKHHRCDFFPFNSGSLQRVTVDTHGLAVTRELQSELLQKKESREGRKRGRKLRYQGILVQTFDLYVSHQPTHTYTHAQSCTHMYTHETTLTCFKMYTLTTHTDLSYKVTCTLHPPTHPPPSTGILCTHTKPHSYTPQTYCHIYPLHAHSPIYPHLFKLILGSLVGCAGLLLLCHAVSVQPVHIQLLCQHLQCHLRWLTNLLVIMLILRGGYRAMNEAMRSMCTVVSRKMLCPWAFFQETMVCV